MYQEFTDEQRRLLLNLSQYYAAYIDAERERHRTSDFPLHWKTVSGRDYLYEIIDSRGNAKSKGPRSSKTEALHQAWHDAKLRGDNARTLLVEIGRMYRAMRLGSISGEAAAILREADRRELLGNSLIVVGTNAMPAYEVEAQHRIGTGLDETQDLDMAWIGHLTFAGTAPSPHSGDPFWRMLKAVDSTYTVNTERNFQARNAKAYEVELLVAPSRVASMGKTDKPVPMPLPEQEWLLNGRFVDHVICARDGSAARIVAPDPRWFALHKLWMSDQEKRTALKRPKDRKQGLRLLDSIARHMPHYALDDTFAAELPDELRRYFDDWRQNSGATPPPPPAW